MRLCGKVVGKRPTYLSRYRVIGIKNILAIKNVVSLVGKSDNVSLFVGQFVNKHSFSAFINRTSARKFAKNQIKKAFARKPEAIVSNAAVGRGIRPGKDEFAAIVNGKIAFATDFKRNFAVVNKPYGNDRRVRRHLFCLNKGLVKIRFHPFKPPTAVLFKMVF